MEISHIDESCHFATCERQDLIGATNHSLDILRKL
jgi:hypothetical protein